MPRLSDIPEGKLLLNGVLSFGKVITSVHSEVTDERKLAVFTIKGDHESNSEAH